MESNTRKFINFDLDTNLMKTYNLSRYYVYSNIKTFMEKNNFEHVQYSGYESKEPLLDFKVIKLIEKMKFDLPWISPLIKDIVITEIKEHWKDPLLLVLPFYTILIIIRITELIDYYIKLWKIIKLEKKENY